MVAHRGAPNQLDRDPTLAAFPPHLLETLRAEGINTITDWRQLPRRRRYGIFGVTPATAKKLDAAAREMRA